MVNYTAQIKDHPRLEQQLANSGTEEFETP